MLHTARVEGRTPAALVVAGELEIVALPGHADSDPADAGPGVEPGAKGLERQIVRGPREPGEAECCPEKLAALVEHAAMLHQRPGRACTGARLPQRAMRPVNGTVNARGSGAQPRPGR